MSVRLLAFVSIAAAMLAPAVEAKGRMTMTVGDSSPAVGQPVTVVMRYEQVLPAKALLRVIAVAPGTGWYDVVGVVTGASGSARAEIPRDGFPVQLSRVAPHRWRAFVRFPRPGRWLLVVANWGDAPGFAIPPPIRRPLQVSA